MRATLVPILLLAQVLAYGAAAAHARHPSEVGIASFYARELRGKPTASGRPYDERQLTAAHPSLPMGTVVRVTNLENKRSVKLEITDRGPFRRDRVIDVSERAAHLLGFERAGTARVRVQVLSR